MITETQIESIVNEHFTGTDFFLVEVLIKSQNRIFVFFDKKEGLVGINDCVALSKFIESKLDREQEDFELEVSSAGMESAFKVIDQYLKHRDKEVSIIKKDGIKLSGVLKSADVETVEIEVEEKIKSASSGKKETVKRRVKIEQHQIKETKRIFKF